MKTLMNNEELSIQSLDAYDVLVNIIGARNITPSGEELIHSCPLPFGGHKNGDSNPSASINTQTLLFNCFTCGGGDVVWLVSNVLGTTRAEAISILRKEADGTKLVPVDQFVDKLKGIFNELPKDREEIPIFSSNILARWIGPCDYLTARGVSLDIQKQMLTGIDTGRVEMAGQTAVQVDRVVIPHFINGKLVGWVARKISDVPGVPKYRNSKGFPRGAWLFNLDNARDYEHVYVVESPMSVLVLKSRGINNVVATFGAKVEEKQINLLRQFSKVTVFMDGDDAGRKATLHLVEKLNCYTRLRVIETPDGEDPASLTDIPDSMSAMEWELTHQ